MVAVQLSMFFAVVLLATAIRLYHVVLALSTTFLKFFKTFFEVVCRFLRQPDYNNIFSKPCQQLF